MEHYPHPAGPVSDVLRRIGRVLFFTKPRPLSLSDYSAENSLRPARLVVDTTDPPRFCPAELPWNAQEVLDGEFKLYWNIAVDGQARRAEEHQR